MLGTGLRPLSFDVLRLDLAEEAGKAHYPGLISHCLLHLLWETWGFVFFCLLRPPFVVAALGAGVDYWMGLPSGETSCPPAPSVGCLRYEYISGAGVGGQLPSSPAVLCSSSRKLLTTWLGYRKCRGGAVGIS